MIRRLPSGVLYSIMAAAILLALIWWWLPGFVLSLLVQSCAAVIICASLRVLVGMGGIISFGHALYVGAGAYGTAHLLQAVEAQHFFVPLLLAPVAGGVAGLLVAVVAGWLCTRRTHPIFMAMVTLALCELAYTLAQMWPALFGDESGIPFDRTAGNFLGLNFADERLVLILALLYSVVVLFLLHGFTRTPAGKWLVASREDAMRVASLGMYPARFQYMAFLIAGFFAGIGGGLLAIELEGAHASMLSVVQSGSYLMFTYLGGLGSVVGSLIGGSAFSLGIVWLPAITPVWELYLGLLFVYVVLYWPQGIVGAINSGYLQWLNHKELRSKMVLMAVAKAGCCIGAIGMVESGYRFWRAYMAASGNGFPLAELLSGWLIACMAICIICLGSIFALQRQSHRKAGRAS